MDKVKSQQQAAEYLQDDQYSEAIAVYEQGIDAYPDYIPNYWHLGLALLLQGEESLAQTVWLSVLAQAPPQEIDVLTNSLLEVLEAEALRHLQSGNPQLAERIYWQIIELDPTHTEAYLGLGMVFLQKNDFEAAASKFRKYLERESSYYAAYYHLGSCLIQQNKLDEAIENFQRAVELNPEFAEAYQSWGFCLLEQGQSEQAISNLNKAIKLNADCYEAYLNLGCCFNKQGKLDEAIANFKKTIEIKPNFHKAYSNLGACLQKKGNIDAAISNIEKAISLNKDYPEAYFNLGVCLREQGNIDAAISSIEKAIALKDDYPEAYYRLGMFLREKGNIDAAISSIEKAIALKDDYPEAYYSLGLYLRDKGKLNEAISKLQEALIIKPDLTEASDRIKELIKYSQAGYSPQVEQGYGIWDAMLFKDDNIYRLFYLVGDRKATPFWSVGEVGAAISTDLKKWQYLGIVLKPDPEHHWQSGRMLAGSVYKENEIYYFFYSAAPPGMLTLTEGIGLATSADGLHWERRSSQFVEPDARFYDYTPTIYQGVETKHYAWRDPYILKEPSTGKYYMFISACCKGKNSSFQGCVGLAVADKIDGPYQVLPPAAYPVMEETDEGIYYELERPQVSYKEGKYYLFFSMGPQFINPKWLEKVGKDRVTNSSVYWYVSETITGPFKAMVEKPVVKGSENTGLYGTNFITGPDGGLFAYGCYYNTATLEVSPRFPVRWENGSMEILCE